MGFLNQGSGTALVTGATGFIGVHLVRALKRAQYKVRVYSRQPFQGVLINEIEESDWISGELNEQSKLIKASQGVDFVFHLAGIADTGATNKRQIQDVNILGTKNVYLASVHNKVKKFVYLSSILAAKPSSSVYARSKLEAEQLLLSSIGPSAPTRVLVLRAANVFGPGMRGFIATYIRLACRGYLPALPQLDDSISMVSVQDLCSVAISIAEANSSSSGPEIHTVSDGEQYSSKRIEAAVYSCLGRRLPCWQIPRVALYVMALLMGIANLTGIKKNQVGLRLYQSLNGIQSEAEGYVSFKFATTATIESEMKKIIESMGIT